MRIDSKTKSFINHHGFSEEDILDASSMKPKEYRQKLKETGKKFAIGVTRCNRAGHSLRDRHGSCVMCNPSSIAHMERYHSSGYLYFAITETRPGLTKVGISHDPEGRLRSLNSQSYGGIANWKMPLVLKVSNAGKIESLIGKPFPTLYFDYQKGTTETYSREILDANITDVLIHAAGILESQNEIEGSFSIKNYLSSIYGLETIKPVQSNVKTEQYQQKNKANKKKAARNQKPESTRESSTSGNGLFASHNKKVKQSQSTHLRPYFRLSAKELCALIEPNKNNPTTLLAIDNEIKRRNRSKKILKNAAQSIRFYLDAHTEESSTEEKSKDSLIATDQTSQQPVNNPLSETNGKSNKVVALMKSNHSEQKSTAQGIEENLSCPADVDINTSQKDYTKGINVPWWVWLIGATFIIKALMALGRQ